MNVCKKFSHQQVHQLLDEVLGRACTPNASLRSPMPHWT
jgi:hypothetical protein